VKLVSATYNRPILCRFSGSWLYDKPVSVTAECEQFGDEVLVIWTLETLEALASLDFSGDELVGATEAVERAFFESEREECRVASVRQRGVPYVGEVSTEDSFAAMRVLNSIRDAEQGAA
jgi:hypothetical protein